jgi:hypothetical protein
LKLACSHRDRRARLKRTLQGIRGFDDAVRFGYLVNRSMDNRQEMACLERRFVLPMLLSLGTPAL